MWGRPTLGYSLRLIWAVKYFWLPAELKARAAFPRDFFSIFNNWLNISHKFISELLYWRNYSHAEDVQHKSNDCVPRSGLHVALRADWSMLVTWAGERQTAAFDWRSSSGWDACVCVSDTVSSASADSMKYLQDTQPQENNRMDKGHKRWVHR